MLNSMFFSNALDNGAYRKTIDRSLVSVGDSARTRAAVARARAGEPVTIAFIGGSITEGYNASAPDRSYARLFHREFAARYGVNGGENVTYRNAGMAGTPSTLGMIRYRRDVIGGDGRAPDVVVVEFAVNDGDDVTNGAAYESLVAEILGAPNAPAVILLFSVFKSRWNLQDRLMPIGEAYGLPMVSVRDAVVPELDAGRMGDDEFFDDIYHPTDFGHRVIADCLARYLDEFDAARASPGARTESPESLPPAVIGRQFVGIRMLDRERVSAGASVVPGAFSAVDPALAVFGKEASRPIFPSNWHKPDGSDAGEFRMEIECRALVVVYKRSVDSGAFGVAEALVDGEVVDTLDGAPPGSWNNAFARVLADGTERARRVVTIRMEAGYEASAFTILAFGYTE